MTLRQLLNQGKELLSALPDGDFCATQLLMKAFALTREQLIVSSHQPPNPALAEEYLALCQRLCSGSPLQYLIGEWEFFGLPFKVGEGVLIPRPDTETVVEQALELVKGTPSPAILDLCSGSGCIAITIANARPDSTVTAVELSDLALPYLHHNAALNGCVNLSVVQADVLSWTSDKYYHMIVSNPPYITAEDMATLEPQVRCEPHMALFGGDDGLVFYRRITESAWAMLEQGGHLVFELGYNQYDDVCAIMLAQGFESIGCKEDLSGIRRCIYGVKT